MYGKLLTPTCFTQAPLYSTVLSTQPTLPLSVSADNTPATRAARTSARVRKRQTASLSPGSPPLSSTTITTPSSATTTTTPCRDQITPELSSVFPATTGTVVFPEDHISLPISFFPTCLQTTVGPHHNSQTNAYA